MHIKEKVFIIVTVIFLSLFSSADPIDNSEGTCYSESEVAVRGESLGEMCGHKFVRGLTNVVTGVGEIPRQMVISYKNDGPALFVPVGFFTGIFMTVGRTAYGAVETATFIAPLDGTYDSLLKPAFVWGPITKKNNKNLDGEKN